MQLRQGVDEVAEQGWLGMFPPVPRRVLARVAEPEVGREIDDGRGERLQLVDLAAGLAVRERKKEHVNRLEGGARLELQLGAAAQMRVHAVHELPTQTLGAHLGHLDLGVRQQQAEQLTAGVASTTDDRCPFHRPVSRRAG